ncbi:MAG TPA: NlpC/P60 family protein [Acidimicrobiales bacterium]|nr:NlpC/P60 family protein [Acidimicrobiales bacterium]
MAVALGAALTSGLVVPRASADQISNLKAQAAAIASRINALGLQEDALSERYDQAQMVVAQLQQKVADAARQLSAAQAAAERARKVLQQDAIQAYIDGGQNPLQSGSNIVESANKSLLRAEYVDTLATDQTNAIDRYRLATLQEQAAQNRYKQQESAAQAQLQQVRSDEASVSSLAAQLRATESQVSGQIATLVAQQEAAQAAAAAAAERARLAAEQAAQQAALQAAAQTTSAPVSLGPAPPPSSAAAGAVQAALSRVGDWYQWGAAGPNTFDCSGLIMWAYAQVGISLPHYSGAQYADTTHIPMSDLQPGDLVFFSDPGEHVAMYIGNGDIVEAPHTGAQVHVVPMYPEFTLASRVE